MLSYSYLCSVSEKIMQTQDLSQQQGQQQAQVQQQQLLPQQVLLVRLTEMPAQVLQQRVEQELMENPWLERKEAEDEDFGGLSSPDGMSGEGADDAAFDYRSEDDMPDFLTGPSHSNNAAEFVAYDDTLSLIDRLREQMADFDLTDHEKELMEYLIGSLDEDGLLKKSLAILADEAEIYQDLQTSPEELERMLRVLQQFDPPGIGARSLQECLILQVRRSEKMAYRKELLVLLDRYFDDFINNRWQALARKLNVKPWDIEQIQKELQRLNPRPGGAFEAKTEDRAQSIVPDFLVDTDEDGTVTVTLSRSGQPSLVVSPDAEGQKDAFVRQYVERGQMFISALRQRSDTMMHTMKAIVGLQRKFFQTGDETQVRPMRLEDVAEATGYDISTISRVANSKYAETPFGTYPLKWFFKHKAVQTGEGEDVTARQVMDALKHSVDNEDKRQPLSDERLTQLLAAKGFNIARRTVAKYREQMGIPVARMRKKIHNS